MTSAQHNRRSLYPILRKHGGRIGWQPADDESEVILLHLADSGVGGRVCESKREIQIRRSPKISFSATRWPFAKSVAEMRLRPSICTSINSSVPAPHSTRSGLKLTI